MARGRRTVLLLVGLVLVSGVGLRLIHATGGNLHYDEPFWMMRGDYLVENLTNAEFSRIQRRHWNVLRISEGSTLLRTNVATGSGTALLTGLGLRLGRPWWSSQGIDRVMDQILSARLLHVLCSAVTPTLLLVLVWRLGLSAFGGLAMALFVLLDPVIRNVGSQAHLEAVLTLTMPMSLLLFLLARRKDSFALTALSGGLFGFALANRINAAVVPVSLVCFLLIRLLVTNRSRRFEGARLRSEGLRLALFGVCGWLVFVVFFPPIWGSPVIGFLETLYQFAGKAGGAPGGSRLASWIAAQTALSWIFLALAVFGLLVPQVRRRRLFQQAGLYYVLACMVALLPSPFFARYLSSGLPGLAIMGACTAAFLWDKARAWHRVAWPAAILVFCAAIVSETVFSLERHGRSRAGVVEFYGGLNQLEFGEIQVPELATVLHRAGAQEGDPILFMSSRTNHVQLAYLGVMWTDIRGWARVQDGWSRSLYRGGRRCPEGSLQLDNRRQPRRKTLLRYGALRLWRCDERRTNIIK